MMINKTKYICNTFLKGVKKHEYRCFENTTNNCYISVKKIIEIEKPFISNQNRCLIDNNYYIVEVIPLDENYCIRLFIDDKKNIILYYFDITKKNGFNKKMNSPYYEDLYLDVVLKDNCITVLDEDELEMAFNQKHINKDEYILAITKKDELIKSLKANTNKYMKIDFIKYL